MTNFGDVKCKFVKTKNINNMKNLILILLLLVVRTNYGQFIVTNNGKVVTELTCDMNDLRMTMPIPSNYKSYDKILVTIGQYRPNGGILFDYVYDIQFNTAYFDGKNKIDLMLLDSEGKSDLYTGWYVYYSLSKPCFDGNRDFIMLENKVKILGGKHTGWEWKEDKKVKTYTYDVLKTYSINHTIGELANHFYGPKQLFKINQFSKENTEVSNYDDKQYVEYSAPNANSSSGNVSSMGGPPANTKNGKIYLVSQVFNSNETTAEAVQKGLEFLLIRQANINFQVNGVNIPFDHISNFMIHHYWPNLIAGVKEKKETGDTEESGKGINKFKNITGSFGSSFKSGPTKDEARAEIEKMLSNTGAYFTWGTKSLDGTVFKYIELDVYEKKQTSSYDSGVKYVKQEEKGNTRKLRFYIGEKEGNTIAIAIYKSLTPGLNDLETRFFQNFESSFKWN